MPRVTQRELDELFLNCTRVEELAAEIYATLAVAHQADAELASCWEKAAQEELQHAQQFRLFPRLQGKMLQGTAVDLRAVQDLLAFAERFLATVRSSPPGPVEGLRFAIQLEQALEQVHLENSGSFQEDSHRRMFAAMTDFDRGHVRLLKEALRVRAPKPEPRPKG